MGILMQIGIVFAFCLVGEAVSLALPFPFPGTVISMLLLFAFLYLRVLKAEQIRQKTDFLLRNLSFFFIPAGVGLLSSIHLVRDYVWQLLAVLVLSSLITFLAVALSVSGVIKLQNHFSGRGDRG